MNMKNTTQKKDKSLHNNKTKKLSVKVPSLNELQKEIICKKKRSSFKGFEDKIDELFKQNKMDITSTSFHLEKQIVKELKKAVSPSNITPNNDFYSYVNERWLKDLDIEAYQQYITQIDNFRLVQDKVYRELIQIIEEYLKDPKTKHTRKAKCMKNAYQSFQTYNSIEQTRAYANFAVNYIDGLRESNTSIWTKLAYANMNEIVSWGSPFVWSINPDEKNPKKYKCYLDAPQLTLLDVEIYFDDETDTAETKKYKTKYRNRYFKYLDQLFTVAFGENHGYQVKDRKSVV